MNFKTRTLNGGPGRCMRMLSFVMLPLLTTEAGQQLAYRGPEASDSRKGSFWNHAPPTGSSPYLRVVATPALRYAEAPPAPSYDLEPMASNPTLPDESIRTQTPASVKDRPDIIPPAPTNKPAEPDSPQKKAPEEEIPAILPDDLRRDIRPEDVMPFFVFPRAGVSIGVGVQAPAQTAPPSSATYNQQ